MARNPIPSFSEIIYTLSREGHEDEEWYMEGHYHPGSAPNRSGHPDMWDAGDGPEAEIWHMVSVDQNEKLTCQEFMQRYGLKDEDYEQMLSTVMEHMSSEVGRREDDIEEDRDDDQGDNLFWD